MSELSPELKLIVEKYDSASFRALVAMEWLEYYKSGMRFGSFFAENAMNKIAVYGYGRLGRKLINEMYAEGLNVEYVIDRRAETIKCPLRIISPDDYLPPCDVVIITVSGYNALREKLWKKGIRNVISLRELLMRRA